MKTLLIFILLVSLFSFRTNVRDNISDHKARTPHDIVTPASAIETVSPGKNITEKNFNKRGVLDNDSVEDSPLEKTHGYSKRSFEMYRIML